MTVFKVPAARDASLGYSIDRFDQRAPTMLSRYFWLFELQLSDRKNILESRFDLGSCRIIYFAVRNLLKVQIVMLLIGTLLIDVEILQGFRETRRKDYLESWYDDVYRWEIDKENL